MAPSKEVTNKKPHRKPNMKYLSFLCEIDSTAHAEADFYNISIYALYEFRSVLNDPRDTQFSVTEIPDFICPSSFPTNVSAFLKFIYF